MLLLAILEHSGPVAGPLLAAVVAAVLAGRAWLRRRQHAAFAAGARTVTVLAPPQADPGGAAALWGHLTGLLRPPWARLVARAAAPGLGIHLDRRHHRRDVDPPVGARHHPARHDRARRRGRLARRAHPHHPRQPAAAARRPDRRRDAAAGPPRDPAAVGTGDDPDAPLRALAGAAAGLGDGEHAIVQVLARPVTGARLRRARRAARQQRAGQPARLTSRLLDLASPGGHASSTRRTASRSDPELAAEIRAATEKLASPQWETLIRYGVATTTAQLPGGAGRWQARAADRAARRAAARPGPRPGLRDRPVRRAELAGPPPPAPPRRGDRHPPAAPRRPAVGARTRGDRPAARRPGAARPGPRRGTRRRAAARHPASPARTPGRWASPTPAQPRPVGLAVADGRHHLRICGPTGTGKTTLIAGQILADADAGRGVVFIDPKGDAVTDLLARLPEQAAGKVVLFDPGDRAAPPCLNVLQGDGSGTDTDVIIDNVTGIFRRIFAAFWGPRTDDIFRAACLTLLGSVPPGSGQVTLADIPALLGDDAYRRRLTAGIGDPVLRGFWDWYEQLSVPTRAHSIGPLMNKLRAFLLRKVRPAGHRRRAVHLRHEPTSSTTAGCCLARLPKGILGEETAQLVGSFIVARTWQAAARRARLPETARPDAGLYIDEAQNFLNLPYPLEDMLAEARAYRLAVTMAHQNLAQLPADLRQGISANARSQVIFSVSPEDARDLERHTAPVLTAHDLSHLGAYQAAARLVAGSAETPAFTLRTQPLPPPVPGRARLIRRAARAAHSGTATAKTPLPGTARRRPPAAPPGRLTHHPQRRTRMPPTPALPGRPRTAGRLARGPELAAALAARLTARDRWLLRMLHEHRVLTTTQITQLAFGTTRAATARLITLYQHRAVDRFRPLAPAGSAPLHFVLDEAGAAVLAAEDGITTARARLPPRPRPGHRPVRPARPHHRRQRVLHRPGRRRPRQRRARRPGLLVVRTALRRCVGRPGPARRVRPLARAISRRRGCRRRLLPRIRQRHREPRPPDRQARRLRRPGRPHRHPHPRAVLAAHPAAGNRAAHPPRRPAPAQHAQRRLGRRDPWRPGRHRHPRHLTRRASRGSLAARRRPRPAAAARPARPAGRTRPRPGPAARRGAPCPAQRPGLVSPRPHPARLARPPRHPRGQE